jgi:hypothetical protein
MTDTLTSCERAILLGMAAGHLAYQNGWTGRRLM